VLERRCELTCLQLRVGIPLSPDNQPYGPLEWPPAWRLTVVKMNRTNPHYCLEYSLKGGTRRTMVCNNGATHGALWCR
jgi:hypothetical protein